MRIGSRHGKRRLIAGLGVILVSAGAGLLFVTAAGEVDEADPIRHSDSVVERVRTSQTRLTTITTENDRLKDYLGQQQAKGTGRETPVTQVLPTVSGRGVTVELWDAQVPAQGLPAGVENDSLVVHQQDVQAVMNALWSGGASAMSVQDTRVGPTTSIRCVGNVIVVDGQVFSPPYVIAAVGDPDSLRAALRSSDQIRIYQQYVTAFGLGWRTTTVPMLEIPAGTAPVLQKAQRMEP